MKPIMEETITVNAPLYMMTNKIYNYSNLCVYKPQNVFSFPAHFDANEFVITFGQFPTFKVDNKFYNMEYSKVFPINPNQIHYATKEMVLPEYIVLLFDRNFLNDVSYSMYGHSLVNFKNASYDIDKDILSLIEMFILTMKNRDPGFEFVLDQFSTLIASKIISNINTKCPYEYHNKRFSEKNGMREVIDFFHENYNVEYNTKSIAKLSNFSAYYFIRVFKAETGQTPYEYLLNIKINKAIQLLKTKKYNVTEVCDLCGFNNPGYFSTIFKSKTGFSPTSYLKNLM